MTKMPNPANHADHDQLLVAVYAAGDASGSELAQASALVANCAECAALHRDLRSLSAALSSAPVPTRPRDFRISADQAAALARPTGWRRVLAPLSGARSAAGPLAASLAALGMAGLLLGGGVNLGINGGASTALSPQAAESGDTALSGGQGNFNSSSSAGGPAIGVAANASAAASQEGAPAPAGSMAPADLPSAAASMAASAAASAAPSQAAAISTKAPVPTTGPVAPTTSDKSAGVGGSTADASTPASTSEANMAPVRPSPTAAVQRAASEAPAGPSPIVLGSLVLLVAGLVLGLLRLAARRLV